MNGRLRAHVLRGELLEPEPERLGELRAEALEREHEGVPAADGAALHGRPRRARRQVVHEPAVDEPEQVVALEELREQRGASARRRAGRRSG